MPITEIPLPTELVERLAARIEARLGLSFGNKKQHDLRQAVRRMAAAISAESDAACADWLLAEPWTKSKADLCALHLTIGETYFFREPRAFDLVCDYAKEKIKAGGAAGARLRIWSAGCCTGEEPYSIAMALRQRVPELASQQLSILGTDLNSRNLQIARDGIYSQWSFRNTDAAFRASNFSEEDNGRFRLKQEIREAVRFSELNLAEPVFPSVMNDTQAIDIIFCRNVLMYFSAPQARMVIERFRQCLVNGGWIIVSPSEASAELFSGFSGTYYPDAIYFRKSAPANSPIGGSSTATKQSPAALTPGESMEAAMPAPKPQSEPAKTRVSVMPESGAVPPRPAPRPDEQPPVLPERFHAQALMAMESGDQRSAIENLRHALYLNPDSIIDHYLMGIAQFRQGKQREAVRQFNITRRLLASMADEEIVPESEGWSAAYLRDSLRPFLARTPE